MGLRDPLNSTKILQDPGFSKDHSSPPKMCDILKAVHAYMYIHVWEELIN